MRRAAIALELLTHVAIESGRSRPRGLAVVGTEGMEQSDLASLSHRLGVGLARVVAERSPLHLSRFFYVEGLLGTSRHKPAGITVTRSLSATKSIADLIAVDDESHWSVIEAKGRRTTKPSHPLVQRAKKQTQTVELADEGGAPIPVALRIAGVSALKAVPIRIRFDDPPEEDPEVLFRLNLDVLLWNYYEPVRDLVELHGGQLPRLSGDLDFVYGFLPGTDLGLVVHRRFLEAGEDPEALYGAWQEVSREMRERQPQRFQDDEFETGEAPDVDIGLDGLGIVVVNDDLDEVIHPS
jgi:hypothetical protein